MNANFLQENTLAVHAVFSYAVTQKDAPVDRSVISIFSGRPLDMAAVVKSEWKGADRFVGSVDDFLADAEVANIVMDDKRRDERRTLAEEQGRIDEVTMLPWEERFSMSHIHAMFDPVILRETGFNFIDRQRLKDHMQAAEESSLIRIRQFEYDGDFILADFRRELPLENLTTFLECFTEPDAEGNVRDIRSAMVTTVPILYEL